LQTTAAYTKLQEKVDALDRGLSSAVLTFQIALENPQDKNFQKNLPYSIADVTQEIKEVDQAVASLKLDPEFKTELAPVLLITGTDLSAMKNDSRKAQQLIEHYNNSSKAVISNVRHKIEEKLKNLAALDNGTPTPAKPASD
jgi:predicted negative regulator of RcsB-dependent stress response